MIFFWCGGVGTALSDLLLILLDNSPALGSFLTSVHLFEHFSRVPGAGGVGMEGAAGPRHRPPRLSFHVVLSSVV